MFTTSETIDESVSEQIEVAVAAAMDAKQKNDPRKFDKLADAVLDDLIKSKQYPLYFKDSFYLYDGRRYVEEKELAGIVRTWLRENGKAQSNCTVGNVVPIIENLARKSASQFGEMPFFSTPGDWPKPSDVIAFKNGLLDLAGGRLISHTPKWVSTVCLPFNYLPEADCPTWSHFLNQVYEGDGEKIALLQEWFGYPPSTPPTSSPAPPFTLALTHRSTEATFVRLRSAR